MMLLDWNCRSSSSRGVVCLNGRGRDCHLPRYAVSCVGSSSNININNSTNPEQLRIQLDHLHSEAHTATSKANNARLRLLRLSEAVEKLQRQALTCVRTGKEDDARDLLFQKKKVMQALEKSKTRIDLLDQLSAKLNQAICAKEAQLVSTVTLDLEDQNDDDASPTVHFVSPKNEALRKTDEYVDFDTGSIGRGGELESQVEVHAESQLSSHNDEENLEEALTWGKRNEASEARSLEGISSYEQFLEHLDLQLTNIEAELVNVLRFSNMVLEGGEKSQNLKLQQTKEILEAVYGIRKRIANFQQINVGSRLRDSVL